MDDRVPFWMQNARRKEEPDYLRGPDMSETLKQQLIERYVALHGGDPADVAVTQMPDGRYAFHHKDVQSEDVRTDRMVWRWPEHKVDGV